MSICPECKVRENDVSLKELHKCPFCEREFCATHLDPKLAFFSANFEIKKIRDQNYRKMVENEINIAEAHPCIPYTKKRIEEIRYENQKTSEKLSQTLDKLKEKSPITQRIVESTEKKYLGNEKTKNRRAFPIKKITGLFSLLIIICALLWQAPLIISYIPQLSYTKITLPTGADVPYTINNIQYVFRYGLSFLQDNHLRVWAGSTVNPEVFIVSTEGARYTAFALEIIISEIHSDYIVILVKPLS